MNLRLFVLYVILIDFVAFTGYVVWQHGYFAFLEAATLNLWTLQITLDLVIACVLVCTWILADARARGVAGWPWVIATCFIGSISPLVYLVVREHQKPSESPVIA